MKLKDLVLDVRKMTTAELHEHVRRIRHSKYVERPATAARKEKRERKTGAKAGSKVSKLLAGMTEEEREALLKQLEAE